MSLSIGDFSRVVEELYDAALDATRWERALRALAEATGSHNSSLHFIDTERNLLGNAFYYGTTPEHASALIRHYGQLWVLQARIYEWSVGEPKHLPDILPLEEFQAGRFYKEWVRPQGQGDYVGILAHRDGPRMVKSSNARRIDQGPYDDDQLEMFRLLAPHLCKAVRISDALDVQAFMLDRFEHTLGALRTGVLLVDERGKLVYMNGSAERLVREGTVITLAEGGRLEAIEPQAAARFGNAIAEACRGDPAEVSSGGGTLALNGQGRHVLVAHVLPLRRGRRLSISQMYSAAAAIFLQDPYRAPPLPTEAFAKIYKLTVREMQVVMTMLPDRSLPDVAAILGVSPATVRSHMARIFEKTGTSKQSELIALAINCALPVRPDDRTA